MHDWIGSILERLDARLVAGCRFAPYHVTPRQGRHTVRRKLMRLLQRRMREEGAREAVVGINNCL
jgi:hypothetical protein